MAVAHPYTRAALLCSLGLALGCPRPVPDHLRIERDDPVQAPAAEVTDLPSALAAMLGSDPLARAPKLLEPALLSRIQGTEALSAYVEVVRALERGEGQTQRSLQQLEDEWRATAAVALARGYRLRIAENQLANTFAEPEATQAALIELLTPLTPGPPDDTLPRTPMAWLSGPQGGDTEIRAYADRWVLQGWLTDPHIPLEVLQPLLSAPQYDGLSKTPTGALVLARARASDAPVPEAGHADLLRATQLALHRAAADRDREQAAWAALLASESEALGSDDPIGTLLERASTQLTQAAADDRAAGAALLALSAHRWAGDCPSQPCTGLDRVETMAAAGRWHPSVAPLAATWQVIALKEALDTLEVGHDTALFPGAIVDLVDALLGTGGGPMDARVLRKQRPDPSVWLSVSRAVGTEGVVDWEGAREALGQHLLSETQRAGELIEDPELKLHLERIQRRAIP